MPDTATDHWVNHDDWADLRQHRRIPEINFDRMFREREARLRQKVREAGAAFCMLVSPISLRYAVNFRIFELYQSHIPTAYLFVPPEGRMAIHGVYGDHPSGAETRQARPISVMDGGLDLNGWAGQLADDVVGYLKDLGTDNRRVAVEYVNPSLTLALQKRGLEVIDGTPISEGARVIKTEDELACIRWAVAVAEHALDRMRQAIRPGVNELQLWGLVNYVNSANNGDWHDGRMLASGPRTNPWYQEAQDRQVEAGDLVGCDTDMVGPNGYFADISRTFHCGPGLPSKRQKQLYRLAVEEIEHNLKLIRPGISFTEFQRQAYLPAEEFHQNAYTCVIHACGMCDEYPRIDPIFRGPTPYDGVIEAGMVLCIESYMGAVDDREGVKLEQQIVVTHDGYQLLNQMPWDAALMD